MKMKKIWPKIIVIALIAMVILLFGFGARAIFVEVPSNEPSASPITKAQIDIKWAPLHKKFSDAYYALPEKDREYGSKTWLLFQKYNTWLASSWMLDYIDNGIIPDEVILGQDEKTGKDILGPARPGWQAELAFGPKVEEKLLLESTLGLSLELIVE